MDLASSAVSANGEKKDHKIATRAMRPIATAPMTQNSKRWFRRFMVFDC
jgi:hypothetical protein